MFKTSSVKPFLIGKKLQEVICVEEVDGRPTCAAPLKQVRFLGESRS